MGRGEREYQETTRSGRRELLYILPVSGARNHACAPTHTHTPHTHNREPYRGDRDRRGGGRAVDLLVRGGEEGTGRGRDFFGCHRLGLSRRFINTVGRNNREEFIKEGQVHVRARARAGRGVAGGGGAHREEERRGVEWVVVEIEIFCECVWLSHILIVYYIKEWVYIDLIF